MAVAEFFKDKTVLITGGSGFLGKILIEKLLRSCPDIGNIYILIRPKKGLSVEERLEKLKELPIFNAVRNENSEFLNKMIAVRGNVCEINLGLSVTDRNMLINNVDIIYHSAASVSLNDPLKYSIIINVRGTREIVKLALDLKHIALFVQLSTTYSNSEKLLVEEKVYPPHADWRIAIRLAEEFDENIINGLTEKYIRPLANTYAFTKSLGEHVVNDLCKGIIPAIIVRPSVVINTLEEPIPGWIDNFNGPVGLLTAAAKGLVRTVLGDSEVELDCIPADFVIKTIILSSQAHGMKNSLKEVEVINISQNKMANLKKTDISEVCAALVQNSPFSKVLWYPRCSMTGCWYSYYVQVLLFHMVPAFFFDIMFRIAKQKPMVFKLQRKIFIANMVMRPFMSNTFIFCNDKLLTLQRTLKKEDTAFAFKHDAFTRQDLYEYLKSCKKGVAVYFLKEKFDANGKRSKIFIKRLWYADLVLKITFLGILFWIAYYKLYLFEVCFIGFQKYITEL